MKIIRSETIIISKKENEALEWTDMILEEIVREAHDPELVKKVEIALSALNDVYQYIIDVEVEE